MKQTRILIVDDHAIVRKGIQMYLNTEPSIDIVGEADGGREAVRQAEQLQPDVILMDLVMPAGDGLTAIAEIKDSYSAIKIIVLTTFEDEARVKAAMEAGADGYLLKDAEGDVMLQAIEAVMQGDVPLHPRVTRQLIKGVVKQKGAGKSARLTDRERDVLQLLVKGQSNKAIAQALTLSEGTVKIHVSNILSKLNVSSRTEAAFQAMQMGLVSPDLDE